MTRTKSISEHHGLSLIMQAHYHVTGCCLRSFPTSGAPIAILFHHAHSVTAVFHTFVPCISALGPMLFKHLLCQDLYWFPYHNYVLYIFFMTKFVTEKP